MEVTRLPYSPCNAGEIEGYEQSIRPETVVSGLDTFEEEAAKYSLSVYLRDMEV